MAGGQTVTEYDSVDVSNQISLKQFPPKLGKFLLESPVPMTISDACQAINVNHDSVRTLIWKSKQKGNDFNKFIAEQAEMILHLGKAEVYKALQKGAVSNTSTSHNDRKTYFN